MSESSCTYHIDATDRITFVDDAWSKFARENQAPELDSSRVVGKEIWSFIAGPTVQAIYQAMFDHVRVRKTELVVPFRCDSPGIVRQMELVMRPRGRGGIEFEGRMLSTGPTHNVVLFDRHVRRTRRTIRICSFCRRVAPLGRWLEASDAVSRYEILSGEAQPTLSEQICASCAERMV